jgi:hypothetical protein
MFLKHALEMPHQLHLDAAHTHDENPCAESFAMLHAYCGQTNPRGESLPTKKSRM